MKPTIATQAAPFPGIGDPRWRIAPGTHLLTDVPHHESPNQDARPEDAITDAVVVHAISLPPGEFGGGFIEALFCNELPAGAHPYFAGIADLRVSAHLCIYRGGEVSQFVPFDRRAWHAGESCYDGRTACNDFTIGIELEGCDDQPFTDAQYQALGGVGRALMARYPDIVPERFVGHSDIAPGRKTDPGPHFDWLRLLDELEYQR